MNVPLNYFVNFYSTADGLLLTSYRFRKNFTQLQSKKWIHLRNYRKENNVAYVSFILSTNIYIYI